MSSIGIDLAVTSTHKALVVDERGNALGGMIAVRSVPEELEALLGVAQQNCGPDEGVKVIMEATGLAWLPIANFMQQRGAVVYLVNPSESAALGKYFKRHAKSDRRDCAVLARMPRVNPDLKPLQMAGGLCLAGQRLCRQHDRMTRGMTGIKNRIQGWEAVLWPGLKEAVSDSFSPWMRQFRQEWYDPWALSAADPKQLPSWLAKAGAEWDAVDELAAKLMAVARRCIALMGDSKGETSPNLEYRHLRSEVLRELRLLASLEAEEPIIRKEIRDLYRAAHPNRQIETIPGIGEDSAAVFFFYAHHAKRFATVGRFRAQTGMVPRSAQSSNVEKKGLKLTQAGPSLVKQRAYLCGDVARRYDPQIAAIYHDQMVNKGKHHNQAVCTCATHLIDRVRVVLIQERPYELRDVDGRPVTKEEARRIIADRYTVSEAVRQQTNQKARKARQEKQEENAERRRSRRRTQGADVGTSPQPGRTSPPPHGILPQCWGAVKTTTIGYRGEPDYAGYSVAKVPYKAQTPLT